MKKFRIISLLLAVVMVAASIPFVSPAAYAYKDAYGCKTSGSWQYTENKDGTVTLEYYTGSASSVTVPSKIGSATVTAIGDSAFRSNKSLQAVTVPSSVNDIGSGAFMDCENLNTINLPSTLTHIGGNAFYDTQYYNDNDNWVGHILYHGKYLLSAQEDDGRWNNYTSFAVRAGTTLISDSAFSRFEDAKTISLPAGLLYIGHNAFYHCKSLTSITVPSTVVSIGMSAFEYCEKLTSVSLPDSVKTLGSYAFSCCTSLKSIRLPAKITELSGYIFDGCSVLNNVTIPANVTLLSSAAFRNCKALTSITIPSKVKEIASYTFMGCTSLKSVTLSLGLVSIGFSAFEHCTALSSLTIPVTVTSIGDEAFYDCTALKTLTIPAGTHLYTYSNGYYFGYGGYSESYDNITSFSSSRLNKKLGNSYVLQGYGGSDAQEYATKYGINFKKLTCSKHSFSIKTVVKASFTSSGSVTSACSKCGKIGDTTYLPMVDKAVLKSTVLTHTGKTVKPVANVKEAYGTKKISSSNYTLSCPNSVDVGTYKAKVTLKGSYYTGSVTVTYTVVPAAPKTATASTKDYKSATIKWSKVSGATGYKIYRSTKSSSGFKLIKTVSSKVTSFKDTGLKAGKTYYYKISAYQVKGNSTYVGTAKKLTVKLVPAKVTLSSVKNSGTKKVTVTWKKVSSVTGYEIYSATSKKGTYKKVGTASSSKTSFVNSKLTKNKTYYYKVRAYKKVGSKAIYGTFSDIKSVKIKK